MTGALISFSVSALAIRALGQQLNTFEILTIRSGSGLIVLLVLVAADAALAKLPAFDQARPENQPDAE